MASNLKRRNILFVSHVSSKEYGGAERVLDDIISNIDSSKFKVILLLQKTTGSADDLDWDCKTSAEIEYFDFGSLNHGSKLIALLGMMIRVVKGIFRIGYILNKYDVDVVCANSLIAGTFSVIPSRLFRKRFFYYEHNIAYQRKGHLIGKALQPVTKLATGVICISRSVKDGLKAEGVTESKLHLVHNGYEFSSLDVVTSAKKKLPARHQDKIFRLGMVANYMPWKRHLIFLDIVDKLSRVIPDIAIQATIVGGCLPGNEKYFQEIIDWVESYQGKAKFELTGFKNNVADYFSSFDVVINPAKAEPFGLIFIEAMYLGCVVLGSIEGAAPEIIDDDVTGQIVDYDDIESILNKLVDLAENVQTRIEVGECASRLVKEKFSIEKQVSKLESLFLR